jgi:hypothetical protein
MKAVCTILLGISFLLAGCAYKSDETLINSLDHRYEYEELKECNGSIYKSLSMIGLLPDRKLGQPYYFNSNEGMDLSFQISPTGQTLYTSQIVGETVSLADVQNVAQTVLEVKRAINKAIYAKINLIKAQKNKDATLEAQYLAIYQAAQDDLSKAQRATLTAMKPGIFILQWGNKSRDQYNFSLSSNNGYRYNYQDRFKGLIILGGIKISNISAIGKDYCCRLANYLKSKELCPIKQHIVIPTFLLQARHLIFMDQFSDLEQEDFSVTLDQALQADNLSFLDKVELEMIKRQAYSLIGVGEVSNVRTRTETGHYNLSEQGSWTPLYAIMPTVENMYSKIKTLCQ